MDVEVLVLHLGGFGVDGDPLTVGHVVDLDLILVGGFGDGVDGVFLVDLWD